MNRTSYKERISFALGNLGHSAFYGALSTYFIVYVTSSMFADLAPSVANKLIGLITSLVVIIRLAEVVLDPILGNIVDNTESKYGKFKPWLMIGTIVSAILLIVSFTGLFGLSKISPLLFAILFVIVFVALDIFYSFSDVAYWGMVPAISESSSERSVFTVWGSFTGTIGWNGLTIIVVPITTYFTYLATGKHEQGSAGWLAVAVIISIIAILSAAATAWGTKEKNNVIRESANKEKTSIKDVFLGIAHNDQMLWTSLSYLLYSVAYVATNGVLFYYFKYVLDKPNQFWIAGVVATIVSFFTAPLFGMLNKFVTRKVLFSIGQICMILAYVIFLTAHDNPTLVTVGLVLFNFNYAQLVTVLTLTDAIEYGQLQSGKRNEAVTLSIRPLLDKISGAFSNGIVGFIAVTAGMTGSATAKDMTASNIHTFELFSFYTPLILAAGSLLIFLWKVKLSEKAHAQVVVELESKLATEEGITTPTNVVTQQQLISAPTSGVITSLAELNQAQPSLDLFEGTGYVIQPSDNKVYAPFDGKIRFTFSTQHAFGIESENGLAAIIHVGMGTVNLRGAGFDLHFIDGQEIHQGDLLMTFDRQLFEANGYEDTIVMFFVDPKRIQNFAVDEKHVQHGDDLQPISFK
ncbi:PTS sugar transporter subunit IIA [Weissella sagaensis]|uniref:PTS sugar transporter subunit IIA n=1 Tax=Weissella sagaensis TaxID=2559928 RepID=UPI00214A9673|nr:PTS sugar transporter subunit IIA [Weissella sagaensis]